HGARDVVGGRVVHGYVVELRDGQGRRVPRLPAIRRQIHATVVAGNHALRVARVDPNVMVIAVVHLLDALERPAAVNALEHVDLWAPHDVAVLRVHGQGGVIPGALPQVMAPVHKLPG